MAVGIHIKKLRKSAQLPTYGTPSSAGADLYADIEEDITVLPHQTVKIPTGLALELPEGFAGLIFARSSLGTKKGLAPANKVGVIDPDYRGEVLVMLHNHSNSAQTVSRGERVAQLMIVPYLKVRFIEKETLSETSRGEGGFGSTGQL